MLKKISLLLVLALVIGTICFVAFYRPMPRLDNSQKLLIQETCDKQGISPINWNAKDREPGSIRYYGNYEGYDVFFYSQKR